MLSFLSCCRRPGLQTQMSCCGVHLQTLRSCVLVSVGALVSTPTHAGCASEDRTGGIQGLGSKNTLGVSARRSHTQAAQCKVVMPPDGSVTRCLVCPAAADGSGPALCLPDCSTTEAPSHSPRTRCCSAGTIPPLTQPPPPPPALHNPHPLLGRVIR